MSIKETLRGISRKNAFLEKVWIILQWKKTIIYANRYSDLEYAQLLWKKRCGHFADFDNPKTFNEKMWFLKLSNRNPLLTICSDKHEVRRYIADCGYKSILKKEYACYKNADEIDFESLPSPCYIKCNHASGMNIIFDRERHINIQHLRWKLNYYLHENPYYLSREWNYKNISPRIVCEEVLSMPDGVSDIPEIQLFCFHGVPKFLMYNLGLADKAGRHKTAMRWVFDMDWNIIPVKTSMPTNNQIPDRPKNFLEMVKIAQKLSEPFPHVRVDLFNIEGKIYFNELTFYSGGGFVYLSPEEWQYKIGEWIDCSAFSVADDAKTKMTKYTIWGGTLNS